MEYEEEPEEVQTQETAVTEPISENEVKAESAESTTNEAVVAVEVAETEGSVAEGSAEPAET